jgi:magnesium chelatase family protein
MNNKQIEKYCPLSSDCQDLLERIIDHMGLSARACSRIIKLARTIADLADSPDILPQHLSEAASYRFLDKQNIFD